MIGTRPASVKDYTPDDQAIRMGIGLEGAWRGPQEEGQRGRRLVEGAVESGGSHDCDLRPTRSDPPGSPFHLPTLCPLLRLALRRGRNPIPNPIPTRAVWSSGILSLAEAGRVPITCQNSILPYFSLAPHLSGLMGLLASRSGRRPWCDHGRPPALLWGA